LFYDILFLTIFLRQYLFWRQVQFAAAKGLVDGSNSKYKINLRPNPNLSPDPNPNNNLITLTPKRNT